MSIAPDPFSLAGKRILVTGASSGIGRQIAISCAELGAHLAISGRDLARLTSTLEVLPGDGHVAIAADLDRQEDIDRLVSEVGVLDGMAHAAGISRLVPLRLVNRTHLDDIFSSNTFAPMLLTRGLLAKKRIAANGSLVFVASVASHIGPMASSAYAASKSALLGMVRSLAQEVAKSGIRANCIAPGYVRTPLLDGLQGSGGNMEGLFELTPLGMGEPEDVAYAATFLLADASRWITRNYFVVDGGLTVPMDIYA
ncbi:MULTISPECIES: SDR family NAD(P)-dependent oxidoreductase [Xanthomonas]|uniref:SDR family NAD(P)-dependent oxidoreductase n=1 Tax=Xanthomonas TaxID=338 RepID=UPI0006F5DC52|nr:MULTISPECIES: SDR family oxidoreductase [Xanthomonas]KQR07616.1 3-oxoacyl-ACP reductase [Xanthomonas sp. Leaf148]MEA9578551.1 SDR family oxidoreductase [Xanthomonas nasturtii]